MMMGVTYQQVFVSRYLTQTTSLLAYETGVVAFLVLFHALWSDVKEAKNQPSGRALGVCLCRALWSFNRVLFW